MSKKCMLLILISVFLLTGCWDKKELSTISVITGMAIDKGEKHKYLFSIEGVNARELNPKTTTGVSASVVYSMEGDSIAELARKVNSGIGRHVIYSHMKVLVISEELAREGVLEFIDYLERNREIRDDFNFIVAKDAKAADILKITYQVQKSSSLKLFSQLRTMKKEWGGDPNVHLNDVVSALTSPGRQPVMQAVRLTGDPERGSNVGNMNKVTPDTMVVSDSMAVFKGARLKGFMNMEHTRNYLWLQDDILQTSVAIPCGKEGLVTLRIYNTKTKTKADMVNGKAKVNVRIHAVGYIEGTQCSEDLSSVQSYEKLQDYASDHIKMTIEGTVKKAQEKYKADIFGFGEVLYRQHPKTFNKVEKNWDEVFTKGEIDVEVNFIIRRSGIRTKSFLQNLK
ncbi:Ger(x)C family spore germination protein [Bacillus sp. EB01]|uniref:Ger(x)C family spore germination protein n=1 Tax=Bacillus sp. EB01 TaxID=1347086 RepID=UPI001E46C48F|nr:Ger(x)C family spore germination protein [Bacillus sp. EB01]